MKKEVRTVCYDDELNLEAYHFEGIAQPFPNHFHDYYVIGFIESGTRNLTCKNIEYTITKGNILLFNPNDNHGCVQQGDITLAYRGLNISIPTMKSLYKEITGNIALPIFTENVIMDKELSIYLHCLHQMIMRGTKRIEKKEMLFVFISLLIERYSQVFERSIYNHSKEIELVCLFMEKNYSRHITLNELCKCSNLSKSTLLRSFTSSKGITPYRYLQSLRIGKAKLLLENGCTAIDAALQTGFTDQSHFSNFFHMFTGLSPAAYRHIFKNRHEEAVSDSYLPRHK